MKVNVKRLVEVDVKYVRIQAAVRYDEEDMPNDFPHRKGDVWDVTVEVDTGKILDWPEGYAASLHMKICDQGTYSLLAPDKSVISTIEEDYVPNECVPGSHGDYIEMNISADGVCTNWTTTPTFESFPNMEGE